MFGNKKITKEIGNDPQKALDYAENEYVGTVRHRESEWLDSSVGEIRQLRRQDWTLTVF